MNRGQRRAAWMGKHRGGAMTTQRGPEAARGDDGMAQVRAPSRTQIAQRGAAVTVNVDALVLRGFDRRSGARVAAAFERRLVELLQSASLPAAWRAGDVLRAAPLRLAAAADPTLFGERLAQAVFAAQQDERRSGPPKRESAG